MSNFSPHLLRARRHDANLSVERLARAIDRSHTVVRRYESGVIQPSAVAIGRLAGALGCSVADLFAEDADTSAGAV